MGANLGKHKKLPASYQLDVMTYRLIDYNKKWLKKIDVDPQTGETMYYISENKSYLPSKKEKHKYYFTLEDYNRLIRFNQYNVSVEVVHGKLRCKITEIIRSEKSVSVVGSTE
jgi:hypothetical protein